MLVSKTKQGDIQTLNILWDIIGTLANNYARTENPETAIHIHYLMEDAEVLKLKIRDYDYTREDTSLAKWEKYYKETCQSKLVQPATSS